MGDVLPDQDGNVIYEYDVALFVKRGHGYVVKTRDDRLENTSSRHPGADLAEGLKRWCDDPKARTHSALAESAAKPRAKVPPPETRLPDVVPNTRTDALQEPGHRLGGAVLGDKGPFYGGQPPEEGTDDRNGGGGTVDVNALLETAEANIRYLRELGQGEVAEQSQTYLAGPENRVASAVSQLIARQDHVIREAEDHAEQQKAMAHAAAEAGADDDPTEGYDDLPF